MITETEAKCDRFGDNPTAKQVKSVVASLLEAVTHEGNPQDRTASLINDDDNNKSLLTINAKKINKDSGDKSSNVPTSYTDKPIIDRFKVKQIVSIVPSPNRPDKRLLWHARSTAVITAVNPASVDIKLVGKTIPNVSPSDLQLLDKSEKPTIHFSLSHDDYAELVSGFDSEEEIIKAAIAWRKSN